MDNQKEQTPLNILETTPNQTDVLSKLGFEEKITDTHRISWSFDLLKSKQVEPQEEKNAQRILMAMIQDEAITNTIPPLIGIQPSDEYYEAIKNKYAQDLTIEEVRQALSTTDYNNLFENFSELELPNDDKPEWHQKSFVEILRKEKLLKSLDQRIIPLIQNELSEAFAIDLHFPIRIYYHGKFSPPRNHLLTNIGGTVYHDLGLDELHNSPLLQDRVAEGSDENVRAIIGRVELITHELTHAFVDELLEMNPDETYLTIKPTALRALVEGVTQMAEPVLILKLIQHAEESGNQKYGQLLRKQLANQKRGLKNIRAGVNERAKIYPYAFDIARKLRRLPTEEVLALIQSVNKEALRTMPMGSSDFQEFVDDPISFLEQHKLQSLTRY